MWWDFVFGSDIFFYCIKEVHHTSQFTFLSVFHTLEKYLETVSQVIKAILNFLRLEEEGFMKLSIICPCRTEQEGGDRNVMIQDLQSS